MKKIQNKVIWTEALEFVSRYTSFFIAFILYNSFNIKKHTRNYL